MGSMALTCGALLGSAPPVLSKPTSPPSPSKVVGLGPSCVAFAFALPKKQKPYCLRSSGNLVIRAQYSGGGGDPLADLPIGEKNDNYPLAGKRPTHRVPIDALPTGLKVSLEHKKKELLKEIDRLLEETVLATSNWTGEVRQPRIPWEVMDNESEFKIRVDMPGTSDYVTHIDSKNNILFISGTSEYETADKGFNKRSYCSYDNWFPLPDNINKDNKEEIFKDGVLYISFPKIVSPAAAST